MSHTATLLLELGAVLFGLGVLAHLAGQPEIALVHREQVVDWWTGLAGEA